MIYLTKWNIWILSHQSTGITCNILKNISSNTKSFVSRYCSYKTLLMSFCRVLLMHALSSASVFHLSSKKMKTRLHQGWLNLGIVFHNINIPNLTRITFSTITTFVTRSINSVGRLVFAWWFKKSTIVARSIPLDTAAERELAVSWYSCMISPLQIQIQAQCISNYVLKINYS